MTEQSLKKDFLLMLNQFLYVLFLKHPQENKMTYFQHFQTAIKMSTKMFIGFIALLVHAFFPYFFEKTGSDMIKSLYREYKID